MIALADCGLHSHPVYRTPVMHISAGCF